MSLELYIELPTLSAEEKAAYRHIEAPRFYVVEPPTSSRRNNAPAAAGRSRKEPQRQKNRDLSPSPPPRRSEKRRRDPSLEEKNGRRAKPSTKAKAKAKSKPARRRVRHRTRDPDEGNGAETEDEDNVLAELALDEPERFQSASRLRKRSETKKQRLLRKLTNRRKGVVDDDEDEDDDEDGDEDDESDDDIESIDDSESESDAFIVPDDGPRRGRRAVQLPAEFTARAAQPMVFNFKVVFQYFVLLVIGGPKILPLRGDTYFKPAFQEVRYRLNGYRNNIRSQIWQPSFVHTLETYPAFKVSALNAPVSFCDACQRKNQNCRSHVIVGGLRYEKDTHEPIDSDSESDSDSNDSHPSSSAKTSAKREFNMGAQCLRRAELFHSLSHWEDVLYYRVRSHYRDLLRAKWKPLPSDSEASTSEPDPDSDPEERDLRRRDRERRRARTKLRIAKLRNYDLPDEYKNADAVTEWMDSMGFQRAAFAWFQDLENKCRKVELEN